MALAALFDALIIGISLAFLNIKMALPLLMITTITFFVSMAGILRGKTAKHILIYKMKIPGGLVLIAAGIILFLNQNW
jgi:putative Mn2+ efflux pump MntP